MKYLILLFLPVLAFAQADTGGADDNPRKYDDAAVAIWQKAQEKKAEQPEGTEKGINYQQLLDELINWEWHENVNATTEYKLWYKKGHNYGKTWAKLKTEKRQGVFDYLSKQVNITAMAIEINAQREAAAKAAKSDADNLHEYMDAHNPPKGD